jgi:hypothetical protein
MSKQYQVTKKWDFRGEGKLNGYRVYVEQRTTESADGSPDDIYVAYTMESKSQGRGSGPELAIGDLIEKMGL